MGKVYKLRNPSAGTGTRQALWIYNSDSDSNSDNNINLKIHSAFEGVKSFPFKRIIFQFWRPFADGGRLVLESSRNPYAVSPFDRCLIAKYRARCVRCQYTTEVEKGNPNPPWIITGGPVATAFLNRFPEVVVDLQGESVLVDAALECDLTSCVMLPVFLAGSYNAKCLGVVECSTKHPSLLLPIFIDLKRQLQRVGLNIHPLQGYWPYKTISGDLDAARLEVKRALQMASILHALTLAQVWIPNNCHQTFLVKLSWYPFDLDGGTPLRGFYNNFNVISGEGLAWKTLQTHQPHLCKNIYKLSDNRTGVFALLKSTCASFVICLRSAHTGDLDYAFEFFWPPDRNHSILLETLLSTLSKYLPSFKSASGEQLGDQGFSLVDVENSSSLKIPPGNISPASVKKRKYVEVQTDPLTNSEADDDDDDDNDLAILAAYRNQNLLFYLPTSSTLEYVMDKLKNEFELDPTQTYKLEYQLSPGQWSTLTRLDNFRNTDVVNLRVLANYKEVNVTWITKTY